MFDLLLIILFLLKLSVSLTIIVPLLDSLISWDVKVDSCLRLLLGWPYFALHDQSLLMAHASLWEFLLMEVLEYFLSFFQRIRRCEVLIIGKIVK